MNTTLSFFRFSEIDFPENPGFFRIDFPENSESISLKIENPEKSDSEKFDFSENFGVAEVET